MKQKIRQKIEQNYKFIIGTLAAALLLVIPVSSSLAWLTASSDPVVNYFAGSTIALTLDESPVDTDGKTTEGDRVKENHYKYVAGAVLDKDPTVTILKGSEECYVYVCVDNELPAELFTLNINTDAWEQVGASENMVIYRYSSVVASSDEDTVLTPIFTTVTISEDLTAGDIEELGSRTLSVTAFAIQTASLETGEADELALAYFLDGTDITLIDAEEEAEEETEETDGDTDEAGESEESSENAEEAVDSEPTAEESPGTEEDSVAAESEGGAEEAATPETEESGEAAEENEDTPAETETPSEAPADGNSESEAAAQETSIE